LFAVGQVVFQHQEKRFQLGWDLHGPRQNDDEGNSYLPILI
jgi:hypothetical protein